MPVNKVIYGDKTLIDLSNDTISANKLLSGETAHDKGGNIITGILTAQRYHIGTDAPPPTLGDDGDVYLRTGG